MPDIPELDWTTIVAASAIVLVLLVAGAAVSIFLIRWTFRINQALDLLRAITTRLELLEKHLSSSRPQETPPDIFPPEVDIAPLVPHFKKMNALLADIRETLSSSPSPRGNLPSLDAEGWGKALQAAEKAPSSKAVHPPGPTSPPDSVTSPHPSQSNDIPPLENIDPIPLDAPYPASPPEGTASSGVVRARAVSPSEAPPDRGSVISLEEITGTTGSEPSPPPPETRKEAPPFEIAGHKINESLQGKTVLGYVLVDEVSSPQTDEEFSKFADKASRGFFGMFPDAAAIQVDFYREWEDKYLLIGTYEWRKHTSSGGGIRKTWHIYGPPESWITYPKEEPPWRGGA